MTVESRQVGVYEAKTYLARLLEEVEKGESITITRHGTPVARLVPVHGSGRSIDELIAAARKARENRAFGDLTFRELIEEGRRF
jgi:prevent-host-death family protein